MKKQKLERSKVKLFNHIMTHCESRWGFTPTISEVREMGKQVRLKKAILIMHVTNTRSYYIIKVRDMEIPIVYSKVIQLPVSVYPPSSLVQWRETERYKRAKGLL